MKICLETLRFGECTRRHRCHFKDTHDAPKEILLEFGVCGVEGMHGHCTQPNCNFVHEEERRELEERYKIDLANHLSHTTPRKHQVNFDGHIQETASTPDLSPASKTGSNDNSSLPPTPASSRNGAANGISRSIENEMHKLALEDENAAGEQNWPKLTESKIAKIVNPDSTKACRASDVMKHANAGLQAYNAGAFLVAAEHFTRALHCSPPKEIQVILLFNRADSYYQTKSRDYHDSILRDTLLILDIDRCHAKTLRLVARIQAAHGRNKESIEMYEHILSLLSLDDNLRVETENEKLDVEKGKYRTTKI